MVVKVGEVHHLIVGSLYEMGIDEILRKCVIEHEWPMILNEAYAGVVGGNYARKATERRSCMEDYGSTLYMAMPKNFSSFLVYASEWRNLPEEIIFP